MNTDRNSEEDIREDERQRQDALARRIRGVSISHETMTRLLSPAGRILTTDLPEDIEVVAIHQGMVVRGFVLYCRSKEFPVVDIGAEAPVDLFPTITDHGGLELLEAPQAESEPFQADEPAEPDEPEPFIEPEWINIGVECDVCAKRNTYILDSGEDPDVIAHDLGLLTYACQCGNTYQWDGSRRDLQLCIDGLQAQVRSRSTLAHEEHQKLVGGDDMPNPMEVIEP